MKGAEDAVVFVFIRQFCISFFFHLPGLPIESDRTGTVIDLIVAFRCSLRSGGQEITRALLFFFHG